MLSDFMARGSAGRLRLCAAAVALSISLYSMPLAAIDRMTLTAGGAAGGGLSAAGLAIELSLPDAQSSALRIRAAQLDLGPMAGTYSGLEVLCAEPLIKEPIYGCPAATLRAVSARFGKQSIRAGMRWDQKRQLLQFSARDLRLGSGTLALNGELRPAGWSIEAQAAAVSVAALRQLLGESSPVPKDWSLDGKLKALRLRLSGAAAPAMGNIDAAVESLTFANPDGSIAADRLGAGIKLDINRAANAWQMRGVLTADGGELLADRLYWNFMPQALHAEFTGRWQDAGLIDLDDLRLSVGRLLRANARVQLQLASVGVQMQPAAASAPANPPATPTPTQSTTDGVLRTLVADIADFDLGALPPQTRAGLFLGTLVSQLEAGGRVHGHLDWQDGAPAALDLTLQNVALTDRNAGLAVDGLDGHVLWQSAARHAAAGAADAAPFGSSDLSWKSANLYGIAAGGAHITFAGSGTDFRLLQSVRVPVLDGGLNIAALQMQRIGAPDMSVRFDAVVEPISMPLLCKAFGWPEFAGTVSGRIPQLALDQGLLTLGGNLDAQVFDGRITVGGLSMRDAFGARPQLSADITLDRLDLAAVTGAFSFGAITGRLSGRIASLELVGWEPVAFAASLYTPPQDRSKRRISQRAVENISSVGGGSGAAAALERGALRFFKQFDYAKLGISCTLINDVCQIDGIERHGDGYYLVKGSGVPRIDVIGDKRRIDWPTMVSSLKELSKSQATVGKP
jgi:hypothetical protein